MRSIIPSSFGKKIFIVLLLIATAKHSFLQTVDSSFGTNGITNLPIFGDELEPKSAIFQNDKILVGYYSVDADRYQPVVYVYRLTKNGKLDSSFGNFNGITSFQFTTGGFITLQKDNRILVAVSDTYEPEGYPIHVYRLLPNGKHDKSFGDKGRFTYKNPLRNNIGQIAVRDDDKIVLAGNFNKRDSKHVSFFQLTKDGQLDSAFGKKGFIYQTLSYEQTCIALKILPNNKVLCGFEYDSAKFIKTCLIRYTAQGKIDSSFGTNGIILNNDNLKKSTRYLMNLAITHDNKILEFAADSNDQAILCRFTANGKLDKSFGAKGSVIIPERDNDLVFSIAIDSTNRILVNDMKKNVLSILRYTEDGKADSAFGKNGSLITNNLGFQILVQSPNKFIATGWDVIGRYKLDNTLAMRSSVLQPAKQNSSISIYPNPVKDILHINALNTHEETQASVYDATGKLAMFKVIKNTNELDVHQLAAGVYYLSISSGVQHAGIRFIKN